MGEHGVSSENMDKMEKMILGQLKMEKHQPKCRALADAMQSFLYLNIYYTWIYTILEYILYKIYPNVHKWRVLMRCSLVYRMLRDRGETWSHDERQLVQVAISPSLDCKSTSSLLQLAWGLIIKWRKNGSSCLWVCGNKKCLLYSNWTLARLDFPIPSVVAMRCPCVFYYKLSELVIGYMSLLVIRSWLRDTINLILSSMNFVSWSYSS